MSKHTFLILASFFYAIGLCHRLGGAEITVVIENAALQPIKVLVTIPRETESWISEIGEELLPRITTYKILNSADEWITVENPYASKTETIKRRGFQGLLGIRLLERVRTAGNKPGESNSWPEVLIIFNEKVSTEEVCSWQINYRGSSKEQVFRIPTLNHKPVTLRVNTIPDVEYDSVGNK